MQEIVREHCLIEQVNTMLNDGKLTSKQLHWINTTDEDPEIDSHPISFDLMTGFFRYIKNPDEEQKLHCLSDTSKWVGITREGKMTGKVTKKQLI